MLRLRVTIESPAALEERQAGPQHHGRRQRKLDPGIQALRGTTLCTGSANRCAAISITSTGRVEHDADPEAPGHVDQLFVVRLVRVGNAHRLQRHAADRAGAGALLHDLRVHRAGVERALRASGRPAAARRRDRRPGRPRICPRQPAQQKWKGLALELGAVLGSRRIDGHAADRVLGRGGTVFGVVTGGHMAHRPSLAMVMTRSRSPARGVPECR